ncbi:MAG: hypothetical protein IJR14_02120, partial [Synergistaceae bacterium]|nr:hypothetical protein [Synergistaceae bacterium]
ASKVVDANGEPLVVWHGSPGSGFEAFDTWGRGKDEGTGAWFTSKERVAQTYSGSRHAMETWVDDEGTIRSDSGAYNYPVFLNIRSPYVFDAMGRNWDSLGDVYVYDTETDEYIYEKADGQPFEDREDAQRYIEEELGDDTGERYQAEGGDDLQTFLIAQEARRGAYGDGYDGVIFRELSDDGPYGKGYGWESNVYVVFSPTQIKSATDNIGTFDAEDADIYYQRGRGGSRDAFDRDDPETWSAGPRKDEALAILEELDALDEATAFPMSVDLWMEGERKAEAEDIDEQRDALMEFDAADVDTWGEGPRRDRMDALLASFVEDEDEGVLSDEVNDDAAYWVDDSPRKAEAQSVLAQLLALQEQGQLGSDEAQDLRDRIDQLVWEESEAVEEEMAELTRAEEKANEDEIDALTARFKALRAEEEAAREERADELWDRLDELADEEEGETESYEQDAVDQTRTEAFKRWFGDWEAAAAAREIQGMEAISVSALPERMAQKDAEAKAGAWGEMKNERYGVAATIPKETVGKIFGHKGFNVTRIFDAVPRLFENSVLILSETSDGHKKRNNVNAYHHFVNKFKADGKEYYIRFTAYELNEKKPSGKRSIHSTAISEVEVYEANKKTPSLGRSGSISPGVKGQAPFVDTKIAQVLDSVNDASKVVDEDGRPEVWYHATGKGEFSVFQSGNSAGLIYFGQTPKDAKRGARSKARVMPVYLNVKDPVNTKETPVPWYEAE